MAVLRPANVVWYGLMDFTPKLDHQAESPLYRQLFEQFAQQIRSGQLARCLLYTSDAADE